VLSALPVRVLLAQGRVALDIQAISDNNSEVYISLFVRFIEF
jgi:hypothetical protein